MKNFDLNAWTFYDIYVKYTDEFKYRNTVDANHLEAMKKYLESIHLEYKVVEA